MSYVSATSHRSMALDATRNAWYAAALAQVIRPDSVVLDLGAGTGVLGLIAARLGARRVYLVEPEDIISVAREIVAANGLNDVVECVQGRIEDVHLPEKADVIVSVLTGNFLLSEDLLPALFHARDTMLKPGGHLVPSAATMEAVPVSAPAVHAKEIGSWSVAQEGVNLGAARIYAANTIFYRSDRIRESTFLAEPMMVAKFDFTTAREAAVHGDLTFEITQSGICHGFLGWFTMKLGERWLSTSPRSQPLHWSPAFLPLDPPVEMKAGERVSFLLDRPAFGEWTWRVGTSSGAQRHSTMMAAPMSAKVMKKASIHYRPELTIDGKAVAAVLQMCDGTMAAEAIAQALCSRYPDRYHSGAEALEFVRHVVRHYA